MVHTQTPFIFIDTVGTGKSYRDVRHYRGEKDGYIDIIAPAIKYLHIVIPAKAGIQAGTGCRIKSGMTELVCLIARLIRNKLGHDENNQYYFGVILFYKRTKSKKVRYG